MWFEFRREVGVSEHQEESQWTQVSRYGEENPRGMQFDYFMIFCTHDYYVSKSLIALNKRGVELIFFCFVKFVIVNQYE